MTPRPQDRGSAAKGRYVPTVGDRVVMTGRNAPYEGEGGVVTNSPGRLFNGWAVKLDSGTIIGVDRRYLRAES